MLTNYSFYIIYKNINTEFKLAEHFSSSFSLFSERGSYQKDECCQEKNDSEDLDVKNEN